MFSLQVKNKTHDGVKIFAFILELGMVVNTSELKKPFYDWPSGFQENS
jgi:hypothetical protein